jgi:hypothetical protein
MRLPFVWLCLWHACTLLPAQTPELDLQKVLNPLINAKYLYFENQYLYFEAGNPVPVETEEGVFHRNGAQQFVRMGQTEVLKSGSLTVSVDHEDRMVSAQVETIPGSLNELIDADKIKGLIQSRTAKTMYVPGQGSWKAISIIDPDKPEDQLIVQYDPSGWIIKEVAITTKDPDANPWDAKIKNVTIVVRYLNYSTFPKFFPYKVESYVRKEKERYVATGKCKGYDVL